SGVFRKIVDHEVVGEKSSVGGRQLNGHPIGQPSALHIVQGGFAGDSTPSFSVLKLWIHNTRSVEAGQLERQPVRRVAQVPAEVVRLIPNRFQKQDEVFVGKSG